MAKTDLTAARLRELFTYNPNLGVFTNKIYRGPNAQIGSVAGSVNHGYVVIKIDANKHLAHRLAWLYTHGDWPSKNIDHRNGIRCDNRLINLREATQAENCQNRQKRSDNTSGFIGVRPYQSVWRADIKLNGKYKFIGRFKTPELAHAAYLSAKSVVHKFQPVPRTS